MKTEYKRYDSFTIEISRHTNDSREAEQSRIFVIQTTQRSLSALFGSDYVTCSHLSCRVEDSRGRSTSITLHERFPSGLEKVRTVHAQEASLPVTTKDILLTLILSLCLAGMIF